MLSGPVVWLSVSAIAAAASAWIRYGLREEAVPGRVGPAILFALALFLVLAGFILPPLQPAPTARNPSVAILDISASMDLPALPGGPTRLDSGRAVVRRLAPDRIFAFGTSVVDVVEPTELDSLIEAADRTGSRLAAALRAARAAGADSVIVVTDGELEDREDSRREAERLGLQVRELRTATPMMRTAVREVATPARVTSGDTISFSIEVSSQASGGATPIADSVTVRVEGPDGLTGTVRIARPSPGRSRIAELQSRAPEVRQNAAWRRFDFSLDPGADPLEADQRRTVWVEITRGKAGVVLVSIDPDWEPRQLLPVLERASSGGARAYLRIGPERWVRAGSVPEPVADARVRSEAAESDLLVVQGNLSELPPWLQDLTARHSRVLVLARGGGTVPGSEIAVGPPVEGDWFAMLPPPSNPVAASLSGLDAEQLPPVAALRTVQGPGAWTILQLRRDRRGDELPAAVGFVSGRGRRALVLAEGTWRWSARTGSARSVYRGLYAGIAGWLLGDFRRVPVTLAADPADGRGSIAWSVAPGVENLIIAVRDSTGSAVWTDSIAVPADRVEGPHLSAGDLEYEARGQIEGAEFVVGRPFNVAGPAAELRGRDVGESLTTRAEAASSRRPAGRQTAPPLWPYVLAAVLLCAEWTWRHRLGLR
jgi:hypothetical protein